MDVEVKAVLVQLHAWRWLSTACSVLEEQGVVLDAARSETIGLKHALPRWWWVRWWQQATLSRWGMGERDAEEGFHTTVKDDGASELSE